MVEVNALWYNAVCYALALAEAAKDHNFIEAWRDYPAEIAEHFLSTFWNERLGYLADSVDQTDKTFRYALTSSSPVLWITAH